MRLKRSIAEKIVKLRTRHGRGAGLGSDVRGLFYGVLTGGLFMDLVNRYTEFVIPFRWVVIIAFSLEIVYYFMGWIDEKVGFWKFEAEYSSRELNPYYKKLERDIRDIKIKMNKVYDYYNRKGKI